METQKPLLKDENDTKSNPNVSHLHAVKRVFSLDRKSTPGGCQFLGCRLISFAVAKETDVVANSTKELRKAKKSVRLIVGKMFETELESILTITLVSVQDDADKEMFDVDALNGEEVFVAGQNENVVEEVVDAAQDKGLSQDKGKGILVELEKPLKKKDQLKLDEEIALKLHAKIDEEEIIARAKEEKINEANIALTKEWDDIQAKIEADRELDQRLQVEEQEDVVVEKRKIISTILEKRRNHFAAKRAEEKRNKPPTQAQQRKIMCTYLKNMEGKKLKDLKNKSFDSIQKMFDRAFKRVNTFVDFRTDLVEGSSKRVGKELEQEVARKRRKEISPYTTYNYIYAEQEASEINIKFRGGLLGLKVFLMLFGVTAALTDVNAAQSKLVLLENFNENYSKCLRLLIYKVMSAEGVNAASEEVSTAEFLNQKGSGGGSGVKEKSLNRNPMNTSLGIGVSTKSNDTMNEETPVDVASVVKEGVIPL
ncbi:hypothetical protein Tco_0527955 [Tanacetum coccineum]